MRRLAPIVCNQSATVFLGIVGVVLVTHTVSEEVFGVYGLFLTLTQIGVLLTHSGIINHATRYWRSESVHRMSYARFLLLRSWRNGGLLAAILLGISGLIAGVRQDWSWLWLLFPLLWFSNLAMAALSLTNMILNADERHWSLFFVGLVSSTARALLPVTVAVLLGASLVSLSVGFSLHGVALAVVMLIVFRKMQLARIEPSVECRWMRELKDFGRPFILMGLGGWLLINADRWLIAFFYGEKQVGLFHLAGTMASTIPNMVVAGLLQWVFPSVFRRADTARSLEDWQNLARRCDQVTLLFLGITLAGLAALAGIGPYLVGWLIPERYAAGMPLLLPAGLAAAAIHVNQFQYLLLQGQHDSASMVKVMFLVSGVRTVGAFLAAAISWEAFLVWIMASTVLVAIIGRFSIQRVVFRRAGRLPLRGGTEPSQ